MYSLCIITCLVMVLLSVGIHALTRTEEKHIKVGFLFVGDEITPYTENFIKARNHKQLFELLWCLRKRIKFSWM